MYDPEPPWNPTSATAKEAIERPLAVAPNILYYPSTSYILDTPTYHNRDRPQRDAPDKEYSLVLLILSAGSDPCGALEW